MKLAVIYLAGLGYFVSALAHIAAIRGIVWGGEALMFAYFCGIFVVFFPTVLLLSRKFHKGKVSFSWSAALKHCPAPIRGLFYATFIYAFCSFAYLCLGEVKTSHRSGEPLSAATARGFSGHAMAFYMTSAAVMLSLHREKKNEERGLTSKDEKA